MNEAFRPALPAPSTANHPLVARVAVVGVGRIGAVTAVGLAHLHHDVTGIDRSALRVSGLAEGVLAEWEPGLQSALKSAIRHRQLAFVPEAAHGGFDFAFLCVDTPPLPTGAPDLRQVFAAAESAASLLAQDGVLVTRATVPAGTGDRLALRLAEAGRPDIAVVHMPEFLREGHAWEDFREPDRIVIGGEPAAAERVAALFKGLDAPRLVMDRRSAELAKYAANAFLATSISFANEIADLCLDLGADADSVFWTLRADSRIGPRAYLSPGLGFGGHCLPKDTAALEHHAAAHARSLPLLHAVRQVNAGRVTSAAAWLRGAIGGLDGRRICVAGLAFKPGTDDTRESPALQLATVLRDQGVIVHGWDPAISREIDGITMHATIVEAAAACDALVVTSPWEGWSGCDAIAIANQMATRIVFDAPGVLDLATWTAAGFRSNRASVCGARGGETPGR